MPNADPRANLGAVQHMISTRSATKFGKLAALGAWRQLRDLPWRERWPQERWREPFQLTVGATTYLHNALSCLREEDWHVELRPRPPEKPDALLVRVAPPAFSTRGPLRVESARMHLASGSVRLVAAALQHQTFRGRRRSTFVPEARLADPGCCRTTQELALERALVLLAAHRDEFGHGEVGTNEKDEWHVERERLITKTYRCRVLQAQNVLVSWLADELREEAPWLDRAPTRAVGE